MHFTMPTAILLLYFSVRVGLCLENFSFISLLGRGHFGKVSIKTSFICCNCFYDL